MLRAESKTSSNSDRNTGFQHVIKDAVIKPVICSVTDIWLWALCPNDFLPRGLTQSWTHLWSLVSSDELSAHDDIPTSTKTSLLQPWWQEMTPSALTNTQPCFVRCEVSTRRPAGTVTDWNLELWTRTDNFSQGGDLCVWRVTSGPYIVRLHHTQWFPQLMKRVQWDYDGIWKWWFWEVNTRMLICCWFCTGTVWSQDHQTEASKRNGAIITMSSMKKMNLIIHTNTLTYF